MLLVAGVIDGISGGGGLIALPSYLASGIPITSAYACNKMQSCLGTSASLAKYATSKLIYWKTALPAALASVFGAFAATQVMLALNDRVKSIIIIASMIFVIAVTFLSYRVKIDKFTLTRKKPSYKTILACLGIGLILGLYDGFFGPGGGTIALLLFGLILHYDIRVGCGNGKLIIVISNLTGLITYIVHGDIIYAIAIPCSIANIVGSYIGATLATKKGTGFVKYVSWGVISALLVYTIINLF